MTRRVTILVRSIALLFAVSACAAVAVDPGAPTPDEQSAAATRWCKEAGHPAGEPTKPFSTDGCSAWPDGKLYGCCVEHDVAYWCGGSADDRYDADRRFRACAEAFDPGQAGMVYRGVRVGGVPWLPTPWRWGYGHDYGTGYSDPSVDAAVGAASQEEDSP